MSGRLQGMTEGAMMAALAFLLFYLGWFPPFSLILPLVSPVPLTWVGVRWGGGHAALAALVASLLVGMFLSVLGIYQFVFPFAVIGWICGTLLHLEEDGGRALVGASLVTTLALAMGILGIEQAMGLSAGIEELSWMLSGLLGSATGVLSALGGPSLDPTPMVEVMMALPLGVLFPIALLFVYGNHLICFILFHRLGVPIAPPPAPGTFRMNRIWSGVLPALILITATAGSLHALVLASLTANLAMVLAFFFYAAGLSVVGLRLQETRLGPWARVGCSFVMVFFLAPFTFLLGYLDAIRRLHTFDAVPDAPLEGF